MSGAADKGSAAIIGLGTMGGAIARNLMERGWRIAGFDVDAARREEMNGAGVKIAASAAAAARAAPHVLLSLPGPEALDAVAGEIARADLDRRIVVELSTFTIADKERAESTLRAAGHAMLDCPLSGTGAQARERDLVVYASGDSASIAALMPLFADFSREAHDLGAFGNGMRMKFVANLLVAVHNVVSAEAFVLGMKSGLDPKQIYDLVRIGAGNSRMFEMRGPMMAKGRYDDATMKISLWKKDMDAIGAFANELGCPTPTFDATRAVYQEALAAGLGTQDTAAVCAVLEKKADVKRRPV